MAKITLQIVGNISDVQQKIATIKSDLASLSQKPISISVAASGLDAIVSKISKVTEAEIKATEAKAKLANAEARKINAETRAAAQAEKTAKSMRDLAGAENQAASAAVAAAQSHNLLFQSTSLIIRNAGTLEARIRGLTASYRDLARAANMISGAGGTGGGSGAYLPSSALAASSSGQITNAGTTAATWSRYGDFRDNAIDVEYTSVSDNNPITGATDSVTRSAGRATAAFSALRQGAAQAWATLSEGTPIADALGDSVGNIIVKITTWQVVNGIVANIKHAFTDALDTMREVDQELTNIQKVSDLTAADIKRIGDSAYDTASKYGVAADEYLKAVYTFQKAGLGESAEQMAELATKTMLVGDTTAEVATRFLISANAAWKFGGNIQELNRIVDEADKLNNNYAVSLEDIATGLPIVGATAAQVGMTAEQTMAAISTIVASTGQTASKAATALRAIIMNLIGETGELEDGTQVTEETIASLNSVLREYAGDALAAADAAGKILDPMEAISALAKAAEDGFLNEAQLFEVLSGLGGKLRTTQLTALVNNTRMYNEMLADTEDAAGTADREISIMLDSWNAKTQILTNNFTKLIAHLVDTNGIKAGIDVLNGFVQVLDSGVGKTALLAVALTGVAKVIAMIITAVKSGVIVEAIQMVILGAGTLTEVIGMLTAAMLANPLFWGAAAAVLIVGTAKAVDALTLSYEEQLEVVSKLSDEYERQFGAGSEYEELASKIDDLTEREKAHLEILEQERREAEAALDAEKKRAALMWYSQYSNQHEAHDTGYGNEGRASGGYTARLASDLQEANELFLQGESRASDYEAAIGKIVSTYGEYYEKLVDAREAGADLKPEEIAFINLYEQKGFTIETVTEQTNAAAQATNDLAKADETLAKALGEVDKKSSLTYATLEELDALFPGFSRHILDANGNLTDEGKAALESKEALARLIQQMIVLNNTGLDLSGQISQLNALAIAAGLAANSILMVKDSKYIEGKITQRMNVLGESEDVARAYVTRAYSNRLLDEAAKTTYIPTSTGGGGGGKGGGSSSAKSEVDQYLEDLKSEIELEKQRLSFLEASGASTADQVAQMRKIQNLLHTEAEYLRSIGAGEEEVLSLSTEWWSYQSKITKVLEEAEKILEELKKALKAAQDEAKKLLDTEEKSAVGPLQKQLDILKAQKNAASDARSEEEKRLAVEEARIALENAQNERNIRQYNAATGQWEWVANAQEVAAAEERLADANQALADYYTDKEIEALERHIDSIENAYDALRDAVTNFAAAIDEGTTSFTQAMSYFASAARNAGLPSMAAGLANGFIEAGESTILDQMKANSAEWHSASADRRRDLENINLALGTSQGWHRDSDGVWRDGANNPVYDGGGVLRGVGGIKATGYDEIVLPPGMTAQMLTAERSGSFDALLDHLGIVTAAARSYGGYAGGSHGGIGSQHNGDVYNFGSISMSEKQARSTTVYELAQMARGLCLHNA